MVTLEVEEQKEIEVRCGKDSIRVEYENGRFMIKGPLPGKHGIVFIYGNKVSTIVHEDMKLVVEPFATNENCKFVEIRF